jgi:hypothetical protein
MASATALTLLLPWYRAGTTRRSALRLVAALRAAGLLSRWPAHAFAVAVALTPGLCGAAWLLWATRYPRLSGVAGALTGVVVLGAAATAVKVARHRADTGTTVALAMATCAVVAGGAVALFTASPSNPEIR